MSFIKQFKEINKDTVSQTGGKGASLGEMTGAGIPVPPGYVILTDAFERFLSETDLTQEVEAELGKVNHEEMLSVERASEHIRELILNAEMPKDIADEAMKSFEELGAEFVAVRSSATAEDSSAASWAGELDSFLNTTKETLLENIKRCWASLFTPRAIFYRFEKGFGKSHVSVAVVVQKMVNSDVSGIAFSVHPVTEDVNQIIIEAGWGLGEAIVSGSITPDAYVIDKRDWSLIDININDQEKGLYRVEAPLDATRSLTGGNEWKDMGADKKSAQKLSGEQIVDLAKLVVKIEDHYGFPVDIEWAMEGEEMMITQSRPITTLS